MISKEEFIHECNKLIPKEELDKYKESKKKIARYILIAFVIEIVIAALVWYFAKLSLVQIGISLLVVFIISMIIIISGNKYDWGNFKKQYAKQIMSTILKEQNFDFQPDQFIDRTIFQRSGFGGKFDNYKGEDYLKINIPNDDGKPSKVDLNLSDIHATKTETYQSVSVDSKGRTTTRTETRTVTVYSGMISYIKFPFKFKCSLTINAENEIGDRIKLEDIKFNKMFDVYSDNEIEALVILTPSLMEKLKVLDARLSNLKITLLASGEMFLGSTDNMFELKKKAKPTGEAFEYFYDDLSDILAIVNEIKDNNKLFKM